MAACLDYQAVYYRRVPAAQSIHFQVLSGLLFFTAVAGKCWVRIEETDHRYRIEQERRRAEALTSERGELEYQLSVLLRPDNLTKRAAKRLGMAPVRPDRVWRVDE